MIRSVSWVDLAGSLGSAVVMARVTAAVASGQLIGGSEVERLEQLMCEWMGKRFGIAVASGTSALELSLTALGIQSGDEVVVPAVSFAATVGAVLRVGATPVVVDVGATGPWIDPVAVEQAITSKTRAVIPVHLFGTSAPVLDVEVPVLDDACQAVFDGGPAHGLLTALSFYPTKVLGGIGEGGMIVTDDQTIADRLQRLRAHGMDASGVVVESGGTNARLNAVSAAALNARSELMAMEGNRRRAIADAYDRIPGIAPVWRSAISPVSVYAIRHPDRDRLSRALAKCGVPTRVYYPRMVHDHPAFIERIVVSGSTQQAAAFCSEALALPCHGGMTDDDVAHVVSAMGRCL